MFELLPASTMNAVLPVEMQHETPAVGTDAPNGLDIGNDDLPPKKFMVTVIFVSSSEDIAFDPPLPPKKLMATVITVSSHADIGMDEPLPPKKLIATVITVSSHADIGFEPPLPPKK